MSVLPITTLSEIQVLNVKQVVVVRINCPIFFSRFRFEQSESNCFLSRKITIKHEPELWAIPNPGTRLRQQRNDGPTIKSRTGKTFYLIRGSDGRGVYYYETNNIVTRKWPRWWTMDNQRDDSRPLNIHLSCEKDGSLRVWVHPCWVNTGWVTWYCTVHYNLSLGCPPCQPLLPTRKSI